MPDPTVWDTMYRGEFAKALQGATHPEIAAIMDLVANMPASGRIVRNAWMTPVPGMREFVRPREFGMMDYIKSQTEMKGYDGGIQMSKEDMDDEQMGLWKGKPAELFKECQFHRMELMLDLIAAGDASVNFEGVAAQYQYANSHVIGTGDNLLTGTGAGAGTPQTIWVFTAGSLKPLIWYDRESPKMDSNAGTKQAAEDRVTKWWVDYRGRAYFGFWWDFIQDTLNGVPTVAELQTVIAAVIAAFRSFQNPNGRYIHEQTVFSKANLMAFINPSCESVFRTVRDNKLISLTDNEYVNAFDFRVTNKLAA